MSLFGRSSGGGSFWDVFRSNKNKDERGRKNSYDPDVENFLAGLGIPSAVSPEFLPGAYPEGPPPLAIEYILKLVVVGGTGVGKSSVIRRYSNDLFTHVYAPTIGIDLTSVMTAFHTSEGLPIRVSLWDVPYQELLRGYGDRALQDADGIVFVFDACDRQSVKAVDEWRQYIANQKIEGIPLLLLANKIDRGKPILSPKNLDDYVRVCNYTAWMFTTARDGTSVVEGITRLISEITQIRPLSTNSQAGEVADRRSAEAQRRAASRRRRQQQREASRGGGDGEGESIVSDALARLQQTQTQMTSFYTQINQDLISIADKVSAKRVADINVLQRQRSNEFEKTRKMFESVRNWVPHASDSEMVTRRVEKLALDVEAQYIKWTKVITTLQRERDLRDEKEEGARRQEQRRPGRSAGAGEGASQSTSEGGPENESFEATFASFTSGHMSTSATAGGGVEGSVTRYSTIDSNSTTLEEEIASYRTSFAPSTNSLRNSLQSSYGAGTTPKTIAGGGGSGAGTDVSPGDSVGGTGGHTGQSWNGATSTGSSWKRRSAPAQRRSKTSSSTGRKTGGASGGISHSKQGSARRPVSLGFRGSRRANVAAAPPVS